MLSDILLQKLFRYIFWAGYLAVLISTFIPLAASLSSVKIGPESFRIRLDYLLHLSVYFLICLYYLAGLKNDLNLFTSDSLKKFILVLVFLATITEVVQLFIPERAFNPMDWVSNISGIIVGLIVIKKF